jgi:hypothetical protein
VHHAREQQRVGAGADRDVLVRDRGGLAAARIDHHEPAAALAHPARAARGSPGTVHRLPFDAIGFAPSISRNRLRSMSGTGTLNAVPNTSPPRAASDTGRPCSRCSGCASGSR